MLTLLPLKTHGGNSKDSKPHFIDTAQALHDYKYIRFNTKRWVSILVFDIDNVNGSEEHWHKRIIESTGIKPSYTLRTDNGIQFGIFLDELAWLKYADGNPTRDRERIKQLKVVIGTRMQFNFLGQDVSFTDAAGSNRLLGIWRNPIVHDTVISNQTYSMDYLLKHFNIKRQVNTQPTAQKTLRMAAMNCKMTLSDDSKVQNGIDKGFHIGNRNNYLFNVGFKMVFENRGVQDRLLSDMQQINHSFDIPGLTENEVVAIHSSIQKMIPTMYQPKEKLHGKLFQEMQKQGIHGLYNRQRYAAFKTAQARSASTSQKIIDTLTKLFEKGITQPDNSRVSEESGVSVRHWQRLKRSITKSALFGNLIAGLSTHHIVLRAIVTPILERGYEGVQMRVEKVKDGLIRSIGLNRGELLQVDPLFIVNKETL